MILLEGPDGAGKSTLAKKLADRIHQLHPKDRITILHKGAPSEHPLAEYEGPLFNYRPGQRDHIICDRWHVGERVYPAILQRPSALTPEMFWHIELFLKARGALLVYVTQPLPVLQNRVARDGDDLININQLKGISTWYDEIMRSITMLMPTDITKVNDIISMAQDLDSSYRALNNFTTYIGPRYPSVLLLGDKRNVPDHLVSVPTPAFMPYPSTSGQFLLSAFTQYGKNPKQVQTELELGLANACDVDDPVALWHVLGEPKAISLGTQAGTRVGDFVHRRVDHPQYVRRFHYELKFEYLNHMLFGIKPSWR